MNKSYYENLLSKNFNEFIDSEAKWDKRAKSFNKSQQDDKDNIVDNVISFLKSKEILEDSKIIDIGGGSGRYAIPLAKNSHSVLITDISSNMLELAEENSKKESISNIKFLKTEWEKIDIDDFGWKEEFDLSFASMCPAIRTKKGLENMLNSSKKYCLITQFTKTENNLKSIVEKELNIKKAYDPHNDRETVEAIFNILWTDGYEPEISYIREKREYKFSYEEVIKTYDDIYGKLAKEKDIDLSGIIKRFTIDDIVNIEEDISLALIFLDKSIKNN